MSCCALAIRAPRSCPWIRHWRFDEAGYPTTKLLTTRLAKDSRGLFVSARGGRNLLFSRDDAASWIALYGSFSNQTCYAGKPQGARRRRAHREHSRTAPRVTAPTATSISVVGLRDPLSLVLPFRRGPGRCLGEGARYARCPLVALFGSGSDRDRLPEISLTRTLIRHQTSIHDFTAQSDRAMFAFIFFLRLC
jgi:hypothetical protein